jgi:DHA2 family multidrug resistance protein
MYGLTALLPLLMQTLMGYTALTSGLAMIPRGFGALVGMPLAGRLVNKVPGRCLVAGGFLTFGFSALWLSRMTLDVSPFMLVWPLFFSGVSIAFLFVPLNTLALGSVKPEQMNLKT